eukprot:TRINITY_DN1570_c0_g1_i1.p1 TRINITY_DN1570_c0_g1~~TRINITY_DN1570_c0_g1_i1.p1  ORF type:complete len:717 (-),score=150.80 TRINITY_DN1570_c0_g1_i1:1168-3318(-)
MWGLFGKDATKDFPYELQERLGLVQLENKSVWHLYNGKHKTSGDEVSVFTCDVKDGANDMQLDIARNSCKKLKTLRHPSILTYVASVETDKSVMVATERVQTLGEALENLTDRGPKRDNYIAWGIFQVTRGVSFLNNDAKLKHNNINSASVFVNTCGDWKISGLEYVCPAQQVATNKLMPSLDKYQPPESKDLSKQQFSTDWSTDIWGVGCLIWEVFNGTLRSMEQLGTLGDIPSALHSVYKECVAANPKKRPNPNDLVTRLRRSPGYFKNDLIDVLIFLEEIQVKEDADKSRFFSSLSGQLDNCPDVVARGKILPQLINAFEFGNAGSSILAPVFKIGKTLESKEYQEKVVPCLVKLFSSNDRNARFKLLSQIENFVEHLSNKVVNDQVFPKIESGFLDSEPLIREKTVISMIHLAPKLNYSNLDEIVIMKHFTRLVRDEQGGIRTNTIVCLGKIAQYLHPKTRQQTLLTCFARSLKDPFPPSRIAAMNAIAATQQYYTLQETAGRVLPVLCPATGDPEKPVRDQAFKVVKGFLSKMEKVSEDPSLAEEMEKEVGSTNPVATAAASWATWAVGAVTSKFYKSSISTQSTASNSTSTSGSTNNSNAPPSSTSTNSSSIDNQSHRSTSSVLKPEKVSVSGNSSEDSRTESAAADGWDVDEGWQDSTDVATAVGKGLGDDGDGWQDDDGDWGSLENRFVETTRFVAILSFIMYFLLNC